MSLQNEIMKGHNSVDMLNIGPEIVTATQQEPEVKRFKCNLCGAEVMSNQSLKRHIKGHEAKRLKELALKQAAGDNNNANDLASPNLQNVAVQLQGQFQQQQLQQLSQQIQNQQQTLKSLSNEELSPHHLLSDQLTNHISSPQQQHANIQSQIIQSQSNLLPPTNAPIQHQLLQQQQQLQQKGHGQYTVLAPPSPSPESDRLNRGSSPHVKAENNPLLHQSSSHQNLTHLSHHQHVLKSDAPLSSASSHRLHRSDNDVDDDDDDDALRRHLREAANNRHRNHHNPLAAEDDEDLAGMGSVGIIEPGEITGPLTATTIVMTPSSSSRVLGGSVSGGLSLGGMDDAGGLGSDVESERSGVTGGGASSSGERQPTTTTTTTTASAAAKVHYCGQCKKTFYNSYNLKRHVKAVHEGNINALQGINKAAIRFKRKNDDNESNDDTQSQV